MKSSTFASILASLALSDNPQKFSYVPSRRHRVRGKKPGRRIRGAFGGLNRKNPFQGIVCASPRPACEQRHIEGARDWRRSWLSRDYASNDGTFRDANPHPVAFLS